MFCLSEQPGLFCPCHLLPPQTKSKGCVSLGQTLFTTHVLKKIHLDCKTVFLEVKFLLGLLLHCYHFQLLTGEGQGIKYLLVPQGMKWTDI